MDSSPSIGTKGGSSRNSNALTKTPTPAGPWYMAVGRALVALMAPVALVLVVVVPLTRGAFGLQLATLIAVYVIAVVGLDIVVGGAGLLHAGYGIVFGSGAFTVAVIAQYYQDFPVLLSAVGGAVVGAVVSTVVGLILARSGGYMFAVLTLAASAVAYSVVTQTAFLGGTAGLGGVSRNLVGTGDVSARTLYLTLCGVALLFVVLKAQFGRTATGRSVEALRQVPDVAEASGIRLARLKVKLTALSGVVGGFAGGLYAISQQYVSPEVVGVLFSVNLLVMNVIGGPRVAWAGLPGAWIVIGLPQEIQSLSSYQLIVTGAVLGIVALKFTRGVAGTLQDAWWRVVRPLRLRSGYEPTAAPVEGARDGYHPESSPEAAGRETALIARGVSVSFGGVQALDDVNLALREGEVHALVGPNGAGKTTLVGVMSGAVRADAGLLQLRGEDISRLGPAQRVTRGITRTFQLVSLCDTLTVRENVMLGAHNELSPSLVRDFLGLSSRRRERTAKARADVLLESLGLDPLAERKPQLLSAGQQRRVEIARCLMTDSRVLLLDEPAAGLTPRGRHELAGVIRDLSDQGHAILVIEHDMAFVMALSDVVTVLADGRALVSGDPADVRRDPAVIAAYWGSAATA